LQLIRCHSTKRPLVDLYGVLGIRRDAKQKEVKDAFYKLSKIYHPDVNRDKVALEKFQDITAAYETLGTADSRDAYDMATQPVRNQRLSSAAPKKRNDPDDYTLSYKMRKKAHEKIRIKTHPESAGSGNSQQSAAGHATAGSFDKSMEDTIYDQFHSMETAKTNFLAERINNEKGGFMFLALVLLCVLVILSRPDAEFKKGFEYCLQRQTTRKSD
jgi:curved DNA-binding protein CbpA